MSTVRLFAPLLLGSALLTPGAAIAARPAAFYVTAAEVSVGGKDPRRAELGEALRSAAVEESHYYDASLRPVVMRIAIDKVGFKSAGKAIASSLPLVGMFAGSNQNVMRGRVELIDRESGKPVRSFKITCDDYTEFSAGDGMMEYAKLGASFLPLGGLVSAVMEVGQGAANDRSRAEEKLTRGFVMLSYKTAYGAPLYKSFAQQRKVDLALKVAKPATPAPAVLASSTIASTRSGE